MPKERSADAAKPANEDEYIAQLLAKDARDCSVRYSALGMYGAAPERPASRVPKPNTRFLKHILRETDTHNANLKRKEEEEAHERMRRLRQDRTPASTGGRHVGGRESKRRRVESSRDRDRERSDRKKSHRSRDKDSEDDHTETRPRDQEPGKNAEKSHDKERHPGRRKKESSRSTRHREDEIIDDERRHRDRRQHRRRRDDSRHRSPDRDRTKDREGRYSRQEHQPQRSLSPRRRRRSWSEDRSCRRRSERESYRDRSTTEHKGEERAIPVSKGLEPTTLEKTNKKPAEASVNPAPESDDDPLNDLIGPLPPSAASHNPPSRPRGRGAYKTNVSNIEAHFAEGYDPALDVRPDDNEDLDIGSRKRNSNVRPVAGLTTDHDDIDDDWDMALEALRDRALWRRKGAERLREAGFEENVVERWANNKSFAGLHGSGGLADGQDRDVADVQWSKKGEGREWDRGKVVDEDGHVDIRPSW